jgi:hypothetical protein
MELLEKDNDILLTSIANNRNFEWSLLKQYYGKGRQEAKGKSFQPSDDDLNHHV